MKTRTWMVAVACATAGCFGVGMPIIVDFARPVTDRTTARKALQVRADKNDEGAWRWVSARRIVYRTREYWQPHQTVTFTAHTPGRDLTRTFTLGAENITVANARTHSMRVSHDGRVRHFPISAGKGTERQYVTTDGIHLTREKRSVVTMESPGCAKGQAGCEYYREDVHLAVRITLGGEYVHQSVGDYQYLGRQNESHGCVRTSPTGARYFYAISQRGDIVDVTGTTRKFADEPYADEWTFWTRSWAWWTGTR